MGEQARKFFHPGHGIGWFLLLSTLALLGNYSKLSLGFNVDFIFGSVFGLVAIVLLGPVPGVFAAVLGASYTYVLWNHPYAIVIFGCEALWVALASRKFPETPLFLVDVVYWLLLGIPLVFLFYSGVMGFDGTGSGIIALKQSLNGVSNAILASVILSYGPLWSWTKKQGKPVHKNAHVYFEAMAFLLLVCCISGLVYMNKRDIKKTVATLGKHVSQSGYEASWLISEWLERQEHAVQKLASLGEAAGFKPEEDLQQATREVHELFPHFHNMFIGDENARTLVFDPPVNSQGESTIGLSFSDRAWFQQLKQTRKVVISDAFMGRGGVFAPIVSISVPVVAEEQLIGFGLGAINLSHLESFVIDLTEKTGTVFTVLDKQDQVVITSAEGRAPLETFSFAPDSVTSQVDKTVYLNQPRPQNNISPMQTWKSSLLFAKTPVGQIGWTIVAEAPLAPLQKEIYRSSIANLIAIYLLLLTTSGLSLVVSRHLSRSLQQLSKVSTGIPVKIEAGEAIEWPESNSHELTALIGNFQATAEELRGRIRSLKLHSEELEGLVEKRTSVLKERNDEILALVDQEKSRTLEIQRQNALLESEIKERKYAESVLKESEERYRILVETLPHGVSVIDAEHRIVMVNQSQANMFGRPPAWFTGKYCYEVFEGSERVCSHCPGAVSMLDNAVAVVETVGLREDGSRLNVLLHTAPFSFSDGSKGFIEVVEDITERKQMEFKAHKVARLASLGELASGVAHEINNPINGIINCAEILRSRSSADNSNAQIVDMILREGDRIAKIVETLLLTAHPGQTSVTTFDARESVEAVMTLVRKLIHKDGIELSVHVPDQPLMFTGEARKIEQLLLNLLSNARYALNAKFPESDPGKRLEISLSTFRQEEQEQLLIEVCDCGCGIPEGALDRVFDPFFTTKPAGEGTGLGLGFCYEIARMHGGEIKIESVENQYTKVAVTLPVVGDS